MKTNLTPFKPTLPTTRDNTKRVPSLFGDDFFDRIDRHFVGGWNDMFRDLDHFFGVQERTNYPPYNITRLTGDNNEDVYRIELAAAGFNRDELYVSVEDDQLIVRGEKESFEDKEEYLHRGLAFRNFERRFRVPKEAEITASYNDGLLRVEVINVLPEKEVRSITIG